MCKSCERMAYHTAKGGGVYGVDYGGISDSAISVSSAFAGYVAAQKVDTTIAYLKDNPKTSGMVWTGAAILVNVMFPNMASNKMVQGASVGMGVYGLKRLNEGYQFLKGVNGVPSTNNFAEQYKQRMAIAQQTAARQANSLPSAGKPLVAVPTTAENAAISFRQAA
jgi:hypothetical protein